MTTPTTTRARPTMERQRQLADALDLLLEAWECQVQALRLSGLVGPDSPGGQGTAKRRDGTPVDRGAFARAAIDHARGVLAGARAAGVRAIPAHARVGASWGAWSGD